MMTRRIRSSMCVVDSIVGFVWTGVEVERVMTRISMFVVNRTTTMMKRTLNSCYRIWTKGSHDVGCVETAIPTLTSTMKT